MIKKLVNVIEVIGEPYGLRAMRRWKPFSITSFFMLSALRRKGIQFRTIIDAGANVGQFARASSEFYPEAMIYSIEPLPTAATRFRANLSDRPSVHLFETAIGSRDGTIQFFPNRDSQASSALLLNSRSRPAHRCQLAPIDVPVCRLDRLLEGKTLEAPILFKLDLQGYELEALRGANAILSQCEYVVVETVFEDCYEGGPLFEELNDYLHGFGYRILQPLAFLKGDGQIYQMDALFQKVAL